MFLIVIAMLSAYYILFSGSGSNAPAVPPYFPGGSKGHPLEGQNDGQSPQNRKELWELTAEHLEDWDDPTDGEDPNDIELGYELDGKERGFGALARLQHEKDMRKEWRHAYAVTEK